MSLIEPLIVPAMIAKTQLDLDALVNRMKSIVGRVQLDVMDGRFVSNTSLQFNFILPKGLEYEAHLMVEKPLEWIEKYSQKIKIAIMHVETLKDIESAIDFVRKKEINVYLSLRPETPAEVVLPYINGIDGVQIMTVDPGNYCDKFLSEPLKKISKIRKISSTIPVEVDGCMNPETIKLARQAGANIFATGSYIIKSSDVGKALRELQQATR